MDAVAGDQHVAGLRRQRRAVGRGEARGDAAVVLLDADAAMAGDEALGAEPADRRVEQHLVQVGAVDRNVRPLVAGGHPPRLAIDQLTVAGEERVVLRLAGDRGERILQPQRAQLLDGVRAEVDADAERVDLGRGLEDSDAPGGAGRVQGERQRQPADAAADDDDVHENSRFRRLTWQGVVALAMRSAK